MDSRLAVRFKRGGRRPRSHGGYSYLATGALAEHRTNILGYLMAVRQGLIQDLGPTENDLSTAKIVLIDRITTKLGVIRCVEEHIRENSVMAGNELAPCLKASYLAYNNSLRLDLQALGLEKKGEAILTPYEIVEREKRAEEATT
ncbi:MAG: hypothetical protein ABR951_06885 [Candidatus Aminicenantales bacterium]|jgi:hypothetical protein